MIADWIVGAGRLRVEVGDYYGSGKYPEPQDGKMLIKHEWIRSQKHTQ